MHMKAAAQLGLGDGVDSCHGSEESMSMPRSQTIRRQRAGCDVDVQ